MFPTVDWTNKNRAYRHVEACPRERSRQGFDKLSGNTKVTESNYTFSCQKDVRRLDIPVDRFQRVKIGQARENLIRMLFIKKTKRGYYRPTPSAIRPATLSLICAPRSLIRLPTASRLPPAQNSIITLTSLEDGDI